MTMLKGIQCYVDPSTLGPFDVKKMFEALADRNKCVSDQILECYDEVRVPGWDEDSFAHPVTDQTWFQAVRVFLELDEVMSDKEPFVDPVETGAVNITWRKNHRSFEALVRDGRCIWTTNSGSFYDDRGTTSNLAELKKIAKEWDR